jgi:hypothetical protein
MADEEKKDKVDFSTVRRTVGEYWADHTVGTMDITEWHEARDGAIQRFDEMLEEYKKEVIAEFISIQPPFVRDSFYRFRQPTGWWKAVNEDGWTYETKDPEKLRDSVGVKIYRQYSFGWVEEALPNG